MWIKRDDLTGMALSGNKVRKLEFLLAQAKQNGCDIILTCGGIQSNHARASAVAARQLGMDSVLFLRTADTARDPGLTGNLLIDRLVGAELKLITPEQYRLRDVIMEEHAEALRAAGRRPYVIPEGGSNALGSWGYLEAVREWGAQSAELDVAFDDVVFACGSGGTAAGLALGVHLAGLPTTVHAVNVCNDAETFYARINSILTELGSKDAAEDLLEILDGHVGRGYALSTDEELRYIRDVARSTGILLDPVYTGKALYGLSREWQANPDRFRGRRILFLHTGGVFGLYDRLADLVTVL